MMDWDCPDCGDDLFNGQGVVACTTCDWVADQPVELGAEPTVGPR
ncbi:hypothetical protein ACFQH6_10095 [Halobacteriaceae archaeon GCM10025711]